MLQAKVEQLYRLDRLLQEESGTLQSLQQDKVWLWSKNNIEANSVYMLFGLKV